MAEIDFIKIADNYRQLTERTNNQAGAAVRGIRVSEAKLTNIKLKASQVVWNPPQCDESQNPETYRTDGTHRTEHTMVDRATARITRGLCKGLLSRMKVSFPQGVEEKHVLELHPCEPGDQTQDHSTHVTLDSAARSGQSKSMEDNQVAQTYSGSFSCRVYPKGKILTEGQQGGQPVSGQVSTQTVIGKLMEADDPSVEDFQTEIGQGGDVEYYFVMRGECQFHIDVQLQHKWK